MYNPEFIAPNETHKFLWDFEIETDFLILAGRPKLLIVNTKREDLLNRGICHSGRPQTEYKRKGKER